MCHTNKGLAVFISSLKSEGEKEIRVNIDTVIQQHGKESLPLVPLLGLAEQC